jgi:hypothetical protein
MLDLTAQFFPRTTENRLADPLEIFALNSKE